MTDPLPLPPLPPAPALPPVDPLAPGAGGWTPRPLTVALLSAAAATLGGLGVSLPGLLPGKAGLIAAAVCGALGLGLAALLGMRSAGPRSLP